MTRWGTDRSGYWFPAKRYGFGWGFPSTWQGWVTLVLYVVALAASAFAFPPAEKSGGFIVSGVVITVALLVVCWIKGEPLGWRWGK
jgi:hypothetical protein